MNIGNSGMMGVFVPIALIVLIPVIIFIAFHLGIKSKKEVIAILLGLFALLVLIGRINA